MHTKKGNRDACAVRRDDFDRADRAPRVKQLMRCALNALRYAKLESQACSIFGARAHALVSRSQAS